MEREEGIYKKEGGNRQGNGIKQQICNIHVIAERLSVRLMIAH